MDQLKKIEAIHPSHSLNIKVPLIYAKGQHEDIIKEINKHC